MNRLINVAAAAAAAGAAAGKFPQEMQEMREMQEMPTGNLSPTENSLRPENSLRLNAALTESNDMNPNVLVLNISSYAKLLNYWKSRADEDRGATSLCSETSTSSMFMFEVPTYSRNSPINNVSVSILPNSGASNSNSDAFLCLVFNKQGFAVESIAQYSASVVSSGN